MAGIGTTDVTPFLTVKPCQPTLRSHLSQAVCDSGWERTVARALDESPRVVAWAKNHRLGFEVPYLHSGVAHSFIPDFLVDVAAPDREARWIAAVNHWGRLGHWRYAKIHSPRQLGVVLGDSRRDP